MNYAFKNTTFFLFSFTVILLTFFGCNKGPEPNEISIETFPALTADGKYASFSASVEGVNTSLNGFLYAKTPNPTLENAFHAPAGLPDEEGNLFATVEIDPSTPAYYMRAYAYVNDEMNYGNEISFSTGFAIGQSYGGGKIAYILRPGDPGYDPDEQHGLIAANEFFGTDILWGCEGDYISGATSFELGAGEANTIAIIEACDEPATAARLSYNYEAGGYDDWYLPSYRELELMTENFEAALADVEKGYYWSSTQTAAPDTSKAWAIYLWPYLEAVGIPGAYFKNYERKAIAVRSF